MDISALSEPNFSAADWINANYKKYTEEYNKKKETPSATSFIQSYVAKLQLYVQQVNYAVEESSQQVVASMPRIAKEAATLQSDVAMLQQKMSAMRQEVAAVQEETGDCMATLERLNTLQTKLQAAKESLQESDGWGNLLSELEDCFERNDMKGVCDKLTALQKSLQAQEQLPGHAERQTQVEDFKNRLEAMASPSLVQCFAESNLDQAQRHVQIFASIQRLPQLQQYYRAVQKNVLQQQWKQTLELQVTESQQSPQQHFLTLFYDQLLDHCQRQLKWCVQLFAEEDSEEVAQSQPFLVIAELLPALQPTRDAHILQLLKTSNERLELLGQYALANQNFVLHLSTTLEQSHIKLSPELHRQLGEAIFEYFHKFIQQYPRLEETQLSTQVDRLLSNQSTPSDAVRHLEDSTRKLYEWLHQACSRCAAITNDLALCKLITVLNGIFKRQLENFSRTQRQLSLSLGGGGSTSTAMGTARSENWSLLQYTMSQLQCLADFQLQLHQFEQMLHSRMATLANRLQQPAAANQITIYQTCEPATHKQLLANIGDYVQKRAEATAATSADSLGIFPQIYATLKTYLAETHDITLNILLQPIEAHLAHIRPPVESYTSAGINMPAFSFAPQESITQIGQYLLTLPQHLEPLLLSPSALLKQALELCNIKYTQAIPCADVLLSLVVEQCCVMYQAQILQIKSLPASSATQLSVDIEYLSNVLEELGLTINVQLSQILTLLKAAPDQYLNLSSGCEPRLVTAIRQMRNIISTQ